MVRFEDRKLVIEIGNAPFPQEEWLNIYRGILDLLYVVQQDTIVDRNFFSVINLLEAMLPEFEDAKKMC